MNPRPPRPRESGIVFLSGNQRSGKTLVQLMLSSHPLVSISPGSQTLQHVIYELPRHRALSTRELSELRSVLDRDKKLRAWRVDREEVVQRFRQYRSVTSRGVALDLMRLFRDQTKPEATFVGNKKGFYCKGADIVRKVFPEAKFVFLMRDGRGAVASMLDNQPEHDVLSASLTWRLKANRIRELTARYPRHCHVVRYEHLVRDPERSCRELCEFLGLEFSERMLTDYRTNESVRHTTDVTHPATFEPITTAFVDRWRTRLSDRELEVVEAVAGSELVAHGYELARTTAPSIRLRASSAAAVLRDHLAFLGTHLRRKYLVR